MIWVLVFLGIAVVGLITVAAYGLWLWHKLTDLFSELEMLGRRAEELGELAAQIRVPEPGLGADADVIGDTVATRS